MNHRSLGRLSELSFCLTFPFTIKAKRKPEILSELKHHDSAVVTPSAVHHFQKFSEKGRPCPLPEIGMNRKSGIGDVKVNANRTC